MIIFKSFVRVTTIVYLILSVSCTTNSEKDKFFENKITVKDTEGNPIQNEEVTLFLRKTDSDRIVSGITDSEGIVVLEYPEYPDFIKTAYYDYMHFGFEGSIFNGTPRGYAPYLGPNIDHLIVVNQEEKITVELLNHDFINESFNLGDSIFIDMIFHSNVLPQAYYSPWLVTGTGKFLVKEYDGSFVEISRALDEMIKNDGSFTIIYIPIHKRLSGFSFRYKSSHPNREQISHNYDITIN